MSSACRWGLGVAGAFIAIGDCVLGTLSAAFFRRGRWKTRRL
ncbi:hypothetical protein [Pyxidicoccus fallax]|nr:hypothetical protein [Pyxidicoccus fallax]